MKPRQASFTILYKHLMSTLIMIAATIVKGDNIPDISDGAPKVLTSSNWIDATSGKTIFVKFFSKKCSHCKEMAGAWDKIADSWGKEDKDGVALVGQVDCDLETSLCKYFKIAGTPTILYGDPSLPSEYGGDRTFTDMYTFAKHNLLPMCTATNIEKGCKSEKDKELMRHYLSLTRPELDEQISNLESQIKQADDNFRSGKNELQAQYDELNQSFVLEGVRIKKRIEIMKQIAS